MAVLFARLDLESALVHVLRVRQELRALTEQYPGRYEPIGSDFQGANFTVPNGAEEIAGLAAAIDGR